MSLKSWRVFFIAAGLYNLLGGLWGFFHVDAPFVAAGLPPPRYPFAFQLLFLAVAILGIAYLWVARDPLRQRSLVAVGLMTKIAGLAMSFWALHTGQLPAASWWQPLLNDLPWAIGFAFFLIVSRHGANRHIRPTLRSVDT